MQNLGIRQMTVGSNIFYQRADGTVWVKGANRYFSAGLATDRNYNTAPISLALKHIKKVYANNNYATFFLREDGTALACGNNQYGQLGIGTTAETYVRIPQQVQLAHIKHIALGSYTTYFLCEDGTVWVCGYGDYWNLGITKEQQSTPIQLPLSHVKEIACGSNHALFLIDDGTLWACGYNGYGQLGNGTSSGYGNGLSQVDIVNVAHIACCDNGSLALKKDGSLWVCGRNLYGVLGINSNSESYTNMAFFTRNGLVNGVTAISCGANHTVITVDDDQILACGYGMPTGLGITNTAQAAFKSLGITGVERVECCLNHTFFYRQDGTVWGCGQGMNATPTLMTDEGWVYRAFLLRTEDGQYYSIVDSVLQRVTFKKLDQGTFSALGFTTEALLPYVRDELPERFDILTYNPDEYNQGFVVAHIPPPQLVVQQSDFLLDEFSLLTAFSAHFIVSDQRQKLALSFDGGQKWQSYVGDQWLTLNCTVEGIQEKGMNVHALASVPAAQWQNLAPEKVRFAFLFDPDDTQQLRVNYVVVSGNIYNLQTEIHLHTNRNYYYDYEYLNEETLLLHLGSAGDYKVNFLLATETEEEMAETPEINHEAAEG